MKVVINTCYGGFSLSEEAYKELGLEWDDYGFIYTDNRIDRVRPELIKCVKKLGKKANGKHAQLEIVKIPDDVVDWHISECNGLEIIREDHRIWP